MNKTFFQLITKKILDNGIHVGWNAIMIPLQNVVHTVFGLVSVWLTFSKLVRKNFMTLSKVYILIVYN